MRGNGGRRRVRCGTASVLVFAVLSFFLRGGAALAQQPAITYAVQPFYSTWLYSYALGAGLVRGLEGPVNVKTMFLDISDRLMLTGEVESAAVSLGTYLVARAKGIPIVALATDVKIKDKANALFARADRGIAHPRDLVGKKVGISSLTTTSIVYHRGLLQHRFGVPIDKIEWIIKPIPQLPALLQSGQIDAAILFGDFYYAATKDPALRLIYHFGTEWRDWKGDWPPMLLVAVQERLLDQNPQRVRGLLAGLKQSRDHALAHVDELTRLYAQQRPGQDLDYLKSQAHDIFFDFSLTPKELETIRTYAQFALEQKTIEKPLSVDEIFPAKVFRLHP